MKHTIPPICAALLLVACSPQFTRYDHGPGTVAPAYPAAAVDDSGFAAGYGAIRAGDYAAAEAPLTRHLQARPNDAYALLAMGVVMERTDRAGEAISYYRGAALHGDDVMPREALLLDGKPVPDTGTVRDLALFNIARLQ